MSKKTVFPIALILTLAFFNGCESPYHIYTCSPGLFYCADENTLGECTYDGLLVETPCDEGQKCLQKGGVSNCFDFECDPFTHIPLCDENHLVICDDYRLVKHDCGDETKYRCMPNDDGVNACIPQSDSVAMCEPEAERCSPMSGIHQTCENGNWVDDPCPEGEHCVNKHCEIIPDCTNDAKQCHTDNDVTVHQVCKNGKWETIATCAENQTCTRKAGCVDADVEEGKKCSADSPSYCAGDYFYECINEQYVATLCSKAVDKLCLTDEEKQKDICVKDVTTMGCTDDLGASVPCCELGKPAKIFSPDCTTGYFTYWECVDVNGTSYAIEHQDNSHCRGYSSLAYCMPGVSVLQTEICPMGCATNDITGESICHGNSEGDTCDESYKNRCLDTKTERVCDPETKKIVDKPCEGSKSCISTGCIEFELPKEGDTCMTGEHGACVTTEAGTQYIECIDGIYKSRECSKSTGEVCLTRSMQEGGDVCALDVSEVSGCQDHTGAPIQCCSDMNQRIYLSACANEKVTIWDCLGQGHALEYKVDSICLETETKAEIQVSCPAEATQIVETPCPGGCKPTATSTICEGNNTGDACNPATFASSCVDALTERICTPEGSITELKCEAGEMCINNQCATSTLPSIGSPCDTNAASYCFNETTTLECVDGTYQTKNCISNVATNCRLYNNQATCVKDLSRLQCNGGTCCTSTSGLLLSDFPCVNNVFDFWRCILVDDVFYGLPQKATGLCVTGNSLVACNEPNGVSNVTPCGAQTCTPTGTNEDVCR